VVVVSNPLSDQVGELLAEIIKLEIERDRQKQFFVERGLFPFSNIRPDTLERLRTNVETFEDLNRTIDSKRQKLISLELLLLDNSIKSLQLTMGQVNDSVKSLQTTANQTLMSSKKLERLTNILIFVTLLLTMIGIYNISIVLYPTNPLVGLTGTLGSGFLIIVVLWKIVPVLRKKA
jgi:hypothetical protein